MVDLVTTDITTVTNSSTVNNINENTHKLRDEFLQVVYADGSNALTGNLDADSNRIINLPYGVSNNEPLTVGQATAVLNLTAAPFTLHKDEFTATAAQTVFTLSYTPIPYYISVYKNGLRLASTTYTVAGTTVTLLSAAALNDKIAIEGFVSAIIQDASVTGYRGSTVQAALDGLAANAGSNVVDVTTLYSVLHVDDTASFAAAWATGRTAYAPMGRGHGPGGAYLISAPATGTGNLPTGARTVGDGIGKTRILRSGANPMGFYLDSGSSNTANNFRNIYFADLSIEDSVTTLGFNEFSYLIMLNGASNVRFERVEFKGMRGDGVHLGASVTPANVRHNEGISFVSCIFDGVNQNNRNGISIVDAVGVMIFDCLFKNITKPGGGGSPLDPMDKNTGFGMPGAIDIESNYQTLGTDPAANWRYQRVQNVSVISCRFENCGQYGIAGLMLSNGIVGDGVGLYTPQQGFYFHDNTFRDSYGGIAANGYGAGDAATGVSYGIVATENKFFNTTIVLTLKGTRGFVFERNYVKDSGRIEVGYTHIPAKVEIKNNTFDGFGFGAIWFRNTLDCLVEENEFIGNGGPAMLAITDEANVVLNTLVLRRNKFRGNTTKAFQIELSGGRTVTIDHTTCLDDKNEFGSFVNEFKTNGSDGFFIAPTSGTWPVGAMVNNSLARAGEPLFWRNSKLGVAGSTAIFDKSDAPGTLATVPFTVGAIPAEGVRFGPTFVKDSGNNAVYEDIGFSTNSYVDAKTSFSQRQADGRFIVKLEAGANYVYALAEGSQLRFYVNGFGYRPEIHTITPADVFEIEWKANLTRLRKNGVVVTPDTFNANATGCIVKIQAQTIGTAVTIETFAAA